MQWVDNFPYYNNFILKYGTRKMHIINIKKKEVKVFQKIGRVFCMIYNSESAPDCSVNIDPLLVNITNTSDQKFKGDETEDSG